MEVGIGLPATVPGLTGPALVEWARRAERRGFSSLAVLDRLVFDNLEPLVTLAAAGAVTERIRLAATILVAAYRGNTALLAKQLATIDRISGGRLVVGVGAGNRPDDFAASGVRFAGRGRRLDAMLTELSAIWGAGGSGADHPIGPRPATGHPPVLVGGHSDAAMRRAARLGSGWIAGGSSALPYRDLAERARSIWSAAGRPGRPRMLALGYYALGEGAAGAAERYVRRYYSHAGPYAEKVLAATLTDAKTIRDAVAEHADAGCDELLLFPCTDRPEQVDFLADALP